MSRLNKLVIEEMKRQDITLEESSEPLERAIERFIEEKIKDHNSVVIAARKICHLEDHAYQMVLSEFLKKIEESCVSRKTLAQAIGVTEGRLSQIFSVTPNLSIRRIVDLAHAVGLDVWLTTTKRRD